MSHSNLLQNAQLLNATKYMYFNIDRTVFQEATNKEAVKELFQNYWFNNVGNDSNCTELKQFQINEEKDIFNLNSYISYIKHIDNNLFLRLFHYPLKRSGNGEVMLYLLLKNSFLSASSTSGKDIIINDIHYEIKNCTISKKYKSNELFYSNFKLGNSFCIRSIINNIEDYFNKIPKGSEISIARNDEEFRKIEDEYREICYNEYFLKHKMLFIDKNGQIQFIGYVKKEDIFIDTVTEGTIKPMIRLNNI